MDDAPFSVVTDHPREQELRNLWALLEQHAPEGFRAFTELHIVGRMGPLPARSNALVRVPADFLERSSDDQLALGLVHAVTLDSFDQYMDDAELGVDDLPDSLKSLPDGVQAALASAGGAVGGFGDWGRSYIRKLTDDGESERERLRECLRWVERAGFDPNAAVEMYLALDAWFDERFDKIEWPTDADNQPALINTFVSVMKRATHKVKSQSPGTKRATLVRTLCVELGYYPPRKS